ncbi:hypothetical protein [Marinovum sp.]|uniref:hypothetical protein n=1 Tax=Marinovum sp. TaxID=2024839 RepID=UPI002B27C197|nr:hypothetical protein [Marinovum sp.]
MPFETQLTDPHTRAIFDALSAAEALADAIAGAGAEGALATEQLKQVHVLSSGDLNPDSFSKQKIAALRELACSLDPIIEAETRTSYVHDECCTSGGWEQAEMTAKGDALVQLQSALCDLAEAISKAIRIREAERIAGLMLH